MKKTFIIGIALIMTVGTVSAFPGDGCPRNGVCTQEVNKSRYAKTTIAETPGVSRRGNLWDVKKATKEARKKTVAQKSNILSTPKYLGSKESSETPVVKVETLIEKSLRMRRAKRNNK